MNTDLRGLDAALYDLICSLNSGPFDVAHVRGKLTEIRASLSVAQEQGWREVGVVTYNDGMRTLDRITVDDLAVGTKLYAAPAQPDGVGK